MKLPDVIIEHMQRAIISNVNPGVTVERVGSTGLAVRTRMAGCIEQLAFRVPEESWIPFIYPTKITPENVAMRYKMSIECANEAHSDANPIWKGGLVPPFTTHVLFNKTEISAWIEDQEGRRLDFDPVTIDRDTKRH